MSTNIKVNNGLSKVVIGGEPINIKSIDIRINLLEATISMLFTALSASHPNIKDVVIDALKNTKSLDNPDLYQKELDSFIKTIEAFKLSS
ncbi:hypothetical protein [Gilliamella apicola]|uniref:hypothetical protein n=1 Tax=Gilliamella apicola TaxID=1196095 RepID=UPI0039883099